MPRDARADDAAAIAALLRVSKATAMPWLAVVHTPAEDLAWVGGVLLPSSRVRVVEEEGEVVAVSAVEGTWLEQLYVAPAAQGRGLGRTLLEEAQAGADLLDLHVFTRNLRARRFYAAAGFVEVGSGDGSGNEEREPDLHLRWTRP